MIMSALILIFAALLTGIWLRPPRGLRLIGWANYTIFATFSMGFSQFTGGALSGVDALKYFRLGTQKDLSGVDRLAQADFMYWISGTLQRSLPLDYMAFNLIGAMLFSHVALLLLMRLSPEPSGRLKAVWWAVTLMPGFHFWNASFGKDSLQLLAIGAYFYFRSLPLKGGALLVLLAVRPHIAIVLGLAAGLAALFERGTSLRKLVILSTSLVVVLVAVEYLVAKLGGNELSYETIMTMLSDYGDDWKEGSLRNSDTSSPLAIIEFLFRPYFWEVSNMFTLAAFFDSLMVVAVGTWVMAAAFRRSKLREQWLFAVLALVLMAFTNPNPGTAMRKKQLLPFATLAVAAVSMPVRRRRQTEAAPPDKGTIHVPSRA